VRIGHQAARSLDRYIRARSRPAQAWRPQLWLGVNNREPLTANGIYQMIARRGRQAGVAVHPHRFRHHFSHTWLDCGGPEGDLMELNGWASPQMLRRYGASARAARARRTYDRIMDDMQQRWPRSASAGRAEHRSPRGEDPRAGLTEPAMAVTRRADNQYRRLTHAHAAATGVTRCDLRRPTTQGTQLSHPTAAPRSGE